MRIRDSKPQPGTAPAPDPDAGTAGGAPNASAPAGFRAFPDDGLEAGQDKLCMALEREVLLRHLKHLKAAHPRRILNLKPSYGGGFFSCGDGEADVAHLPGLSDPLDWISALPVGGFDAVYALDSDPDRGDPRERLALLARPLNRGGLLFMDCFSADHFGLLPRLGATARGRTVPERAAIPKCAVSAAQMHAAASSAGMSVLETVPYSSCYGNSLWLELMESRFRWERILDWLGSDQELLEFALFLERDVIARYGTAAAPRFMLVLSKDPPGSPGPGPVWGGGPSLDVVHSEFDRRARDIRNLVFLNHLWKLAVSHLGSSGPIAWRHLLPGWIHAEFERWRDQEALDAKGMLAVDGWYGIPEADAVLRHRGIRLGPGLQYDQMRKVLADVFGCFRKQDGR